ncbi:unnamed protein product [Linum tenue]|uniref:GTP-binding protein OBGM, mitochondrial n=1 Tax=Linum tenue TaxID=586396 RepID=A0AAV0N714_9ROSI|nr:unnamed protein product [Linum tenue]
MRLPTSVKSLLQLEAAVGKPSRLPWMFSSLFSYSETPQKKAKAAPLQETRMRDRMNLHAKGGVGGGGCCSFHRSRVVRRGRADGGNGGRGGDVILECSPAVWDFSGLQHHVNAARGGHGASKNMIGTRGDDKVVRVPIGTVIHLVRGELPSLVQARSTEAALDPWDLPGTLDTDPTTNFQQEALATERSESTYEESPNVDVNQNKLTTAESEDVQYNVAELTIPGQRVIVAHGGEGGLGNVSTSNVPNNAKTGKPGILNNGNSTDPDDHPSLRAGSPGSEAVCILELKSIADVGLVGMPNAGKSTLLGALSRAKPTVGHYAFTTLRPNLGKVNFEDFSVTVADIPGLIKGAHVNRGLGHSFLRHIERTKVLAYVVDLASGLDDGRKGLPPWEQLRDLVLELEHHQEGLSDRPSIVVANKIDEAGAELVFEELKRRVQGVPIYPVCAVLEEGLPEMKAGLRVLVDGGGKSGRLCLDNIDCSADKMEPEAGNLCEVSSL